MMNCERVAEILASDKDRELSNNELAAATDHLESCPSCSAHEREFRREYGSAIIQLYLNGRLLPDISSAESQVSVEWENRVLARLKKDGLLDFGRKPNK